MWYSALLRTMWQVARPTALNTTLYFLVIVLFFMIGAYLYSSMTTDSQAVSIADMLRSSFTIYLDQFDTQDWAPALTTFLFWLLIGSLVYILFWHVLTFIINVYNDVVITKTYVHPRSFHASEYWYAIAGRTLSTIAGGVACIIYGVYWLFGLAPFWVTVIQESIVRLPSWNSLALWVCSTVGIFVTLHAWTVLYRFATLRLPPRH